MATDITQTVQELTTVTQDLEALLASKDEAIKAKDERIAALESQQQADDNAVTEDLAGKLSGAVAKLRLLVG